MRYKYGWPGTGAVDYARQFIEGKGYAEALRILRELLQEAPDDIRVKHCAYCGYPYRDNTKPNNSVTCCKKCKTDFDTVRRAAKRRMNRKPTARDYGYPDSYQFWHEYPFWVNENKMNNHWSRNEKPMSEEKLDKISTLQIIYGSGNRKKPKYHPGYEDEAMGNNFNRATFARMVR